MNTKEILNKEFSKQNFNGELQSRELLNTYKVIACNYARMENAIAVLSDLRNNVSYIYYGKFSQMLGMNKEIKDEVVRSVWEENIFNRVHPDDLADKHVQELCFFNFVKRQPVNKRNDYYLISNLRMKNSRNSYIPVLHRMFYISTSSNKSLWLALCLYSPMLFDFPVKCMIVDSSNGQMKEQEKHDGIQILSNREKQILSLINKGLISKEIAQILCVSVNTVSRHRQNILSKLKVKNSIEACRFAKILKLI